MAHPADPLTDLPHDERIRSRKLEGGVATIIADATGLGEAERQTFENELRSAALTIPGVRDAARHRTVAGRPPMRHRRRRATPLTELRLEATYGPRMGRHRRTIP